MCKEVECLAKKFSDTLLFVGVGERDCVCVCVWIVGVLKDEVTLFYLFIIASKSHLKKSNTTLSPPCLNVRACGSQI